MLGQVINYYTNNMRKDIIKHGIRIEETVGRAVGKVKLPSGIKFSEKLDDPDAIDLFVELYVEYGEGMSIAEFIADVYVDKMKMCEFKKTPDDDLLGEIRDHYEQERLNLD